MSMLRTAMEINLFSLHSNLQLTAKTVPKRGSGFSRRERERERERNKERNSEKKSQKEREKSY